MRWRRVVAIGLSAAVFLLFLPAVHAGWLSLDDDLYVATNPLVRAGLRPGAVAAAFTSTRGDTWIPLAWLSYMLDVSAFGPEPAGHHLTNIVLHAMNAGVLFAVLARLTGAPVRSALVAALFAVHPLRVESVAWITERKDVLVALFVFLTVGAYQRWIERPTAGRYGALLACYALALMSKPMAVTLPVLLLLLDYWPLGRGSRGPWRLLIEKIPLVVLAGASVVVTLALANAEGLLADVHPFAERAANALVSYPRYLGKMAWPVRLGVYYPFPPPWPLATVLEAVGVLVAVGVAALVLSRRAPYLAVGYAWYLVALLPVIGFAQVGAQGLADRFTYLPMVGVLVAVVWGVADLARASRAGRVAGGVAAGVALGLLAGQTRAQLAYWRDAETLYAHTLAVTEANCLVHHNLGELQLRRGALDEAIHNFERALAIEPRYAEAAYGLGVAQTMAGRPTEAIVSYRRALTIDPTFARAHNNLGALLLREGARDEALGHFATALHLEPGLRSARQNFTRELAAEGMPQERIEAYVRIATGRRDTTGTGSVATD
jgi:tetratricopeptide (TPR) repeat protein